MYQQRKSGPINNSYRRNNNKPSITLTYNLQPFSSQRTNRSLASSWKIHRIFHYDLNLQWRKSALTNPIWNCTSNRSSAKTHPTTPGCTNLVTHLTRWMRVTTPTLVWNCSRYSRNRSSTAKGTSPRKRRLNKPATVHSRTTTATTWTNRWI
jgi:hypothetical protein